MSYLVDALKKAERERHAGRDSDLQSAATMNPAGRRTLGSGWRWLVAILIAGNVAFMIYVWRPQAETTGSSAAEPTADATASPTRERGAPGMASAQAALQPTSTPITRTPVPPASAASTQPPGTQSMAASPAAPAGRAERGDGSVLYSRVPLSADSSSAGSSVSGDTATDAQGVTGTAGTAENDAPMSAANETGPAPMQDDLSVPQVEINGQLYSTVPGRSFILVDGRRYHEGERLAAGPAVETIEPDGAILNFRGQRYRVPGPG